MRKDFTLQLKDLDGNVIKEKDKEVTLCTVALSALMMSYEDERQLTGKEKADRYQLAMKINKRPGEVDVTAEQLAMVKMVIGKAFGPLVVGQVYELLEQDRPVAVLAKE